MAKVITHSRLIIGFACARQSAAGFAQKVLQLLNATPTLFKQAKSTAMSIFKRANEKLQSLLSEYGGVALGTYIVIFALTLFGFYTAIQSGIDVEGVTGEAGTIGAAYIATKATLPIRVGATFVLTPLAARIYRGVKRG